jgi:hypothetical protein
VQTGSTILTSLSALLSRTRPGRSGQRSTRRARERPNNAMQLTKLRAAPVLQAEVPPCAPAGEMDGGTASQLIRSVGPTFRSPTNLAII